MEDKEAELLNVPLGTKYLEISALSKNGIYFPIFELNLDSVGFSEFQPDIMIEFREQSWVRSQ